MKSIITILLIVTFVFGSSNAAYSQNPEQIYQKALVKEEGEGALLDAINLYKQVADNSQAGNSLQAKALLHIGLCYEKMGKEEALKAYQQLVNNFPGQKSEVAVARERLSHLILMAEKVTLKEKTKDLEDYQRIKNEIVFDKVNEIFREHPDNYIEFIISELTSENNKTEDIQF